MDAKITKVRLSRMLSYDWLKIVGFAVALIFIWVLIFTMTATKIIPSQQFTVCNYLGNVSIQTELSKDLEKQITEGKFSYETIELSQVDLTTAQDAAYELLQARTATDELDVIFVSMQPDTATAYTQTNEAGETETLYEYTYLQSFLSGYRYNLHYLGDTEDGSGYFQRLESYLNTYYTNGYEDANGLDIAKIEADFRTRAKGDKRYKTEAEIQSGIEGQIDRIQKYRQALLSFRQYEREGVVEIVNTQFLQEDGTDLLNGKGEYSINICKTESTGKLYKYVGYTTTYTDEEGNTQQKTSAENMNVCLFDSNGKEEAYRYEGLVYLTNLLDAVTAS